MKKILAYCKQLPVAAAGGSRICAAEQTEFTVELTACCRRKKLK